jgi:hypothetical protein
MSGGIPLSAATRIAGPQSIIVALGGDLHGPR